MLTEAAFARRIGFTNSTIRDEIMATLTEVGRIYKKYSFLAANAFEWIIAFSAIVYH
jgi:hypothetical protein